MIRLHIIVEGQTEEAFVKRVLRDHLGMFNIVTDVRCVETSRNSRRIYRGGVILVRAVKFSSGAQWHISQATPVDDFTWTDLEADGLTDMGKALTMVAEQLKIPPMTDRALPPVLVLISDGQPTDNFGEGLSALMDLPWGKKAVRIAIAIGEDADHEEFIGHPELKPLQANNAEQLVNHIKWVSTAVLKSASSPASQADDGNSPGLNVPIPSLPDDDSISSGDVW